MIVHVVVPAGIDDPTRPSGGNSYDRRICRGLGELGWVVHEHPVAGGWPTPVAEDRTALARVLGTVPDDGIVLIDGLLASAAELELRRVGRRLRVLVLLHLPLGVAAQDPAIAAAECQALGCADALIVTSPWTRTWLVEHYDLLTGRIHLAEPGVDSAELAEPSADGGRLLCVGALLPHKGQDVLVAALTPLAGRRWRCRLVGAELDIDHARTVRALIVSAGLGDRIEFTGPLPPADVSTIYADTDLLVVPSRIETYGMVVLEALARGIPVVATTTGGLPGVLGLSDGGSGPGLLVPAGDSQGLAEVLRRWLDDEQLRHRLRLAAAARRQTLRPWSQTVDRVAAVLSEVAA